VHSLIATIYAAAEPINDKKDLYPKLQELIVGAIAWPIPRVPPVTSARAPFNSPFKATIRVYFSAGKSAMENVGGR